MLYGRIAQEMLRTLYCSAQSGFREIWGDEEGAKLWTLYITKNHPDRGRFLADLSLANANRLAEHVAAKIMTKPVLEWAQQLQPEPLHAVDPQSSGQGATLGGDLGNILGIDED